MNPVFRLVSASIAASPESCGHTGGSLVAALFRSGVRCGAPSGNVGRGATEEELARSPVLSRSSTVASLLGDGWKAVRKRESSASRRCNPPASIPQASPSGGTRLACQQWKSGDWPGFRPVKTASRRAPLERAICQRSRQRSCGLLRYSKVIRSCCGRSPAIAAVCLKPPERIRQASGASS